MRFPLRINTFWNLCIFETGYPVASLNLWANRWAELICTQCKSVNGKLFYGLILFWWLVWCNTCILKKNCTNKKLILPYTWSWGRCSMRVFTPSPPLWWAIPWKNLKLFFENLGSFSDISFLHVDSPPSPNTVLTYAYHKKLARSDRPTFQKIILRVSKLTIRCNF